MRYKNIQIAILLYFIIITCLKAQNSSNIIVSSGLCFQSTKESRFTANFRDGVGYSALAGYEIINEKSIRRFSIAFIQAKQGKGNISFSNNFRPEIRNEYLIKLTNNLYLGSYLDIGSLLEFRSGKWTSENSISYCIWSSLGVSTQINKNFSVFNKTMTWKNIFSMPLVSYVIRPSYSFPYTNNFLEQETFNFEREGLGRTIIAGGKIQLTTVFNNIQLKTGLEMSPQNKKWKYGCNYMLSYLQTKELKPLYQFNHQINFIIQKIKTK